MVKVKHSRSYQVWYQYAIIELSNYILADRDILTKLIQSWLYKVYHINWLHAMMSKNNSMPTEYIIRKLRKNYPWSYVLFLLSFLGLELLNSIIMISWLSITKWSLCQEYLSDYSSILLLL